MRYLGVSGTYPFRHHRCRRVRCAWQSGCWRSMCVTSSARVPMPSFAYTPDRWFLTVLGDTPNEFLQKGVVLADELDKAVGGALCSRRSRSAPLRRGR